MDADDADYPVFECEAESSLPQRPENPYPGDSGPHVKLSPTNEPSPGLPPRLYSPVSKHEDEEYATDGSEDWEQTWGLEDTPSPEAEKPVEEYIYSSVQRRNVFGTTRVTPLNSQKYYKFIGKKEKAMVIFYNPFQCESVFPGLTFGRAATATTNKKHVYASVDCSMEKELCLKEQVLKLPIFKLYSNGFHMSTIRDTNNMNADQLRMLVTMSPVLTQPRSELAKTYLARR